jgi:hypothetical protein
MFKARADRSVLTELDMSNGKGYLSISSLQLEVLTQHFLASVMKDEQGRPFIVVREYVDSKRARRYTREVELNLD